MTVLKTYIIGVVYALICLGLSALLYKLGAEKRYTRKVVHILIGFEWIILQGLKDTPYHLLIICLAFMTLLLLTYKNRHMQMISSDSDNAPGTVYYCVSMSIMSLAAWISPRFMIPFGIAVFCTSLGDGFAGVLGQALRKGNPKIWKQKTLFGSLFGFTLSLGVCIAFNQIYSLKMSVLTSLAIAAFASILELVTGSGLDNITLPIGVFLLSYSLIYYPDLMKSYIAPILLTPLILSAVINKKLLTKAGIAAAAMLDIAVSVAFGNMGFIMMAGFLIGGVLVDKIKRKNKAEYKSVESKDDKTRDVYQVLANGLPAFFFSVLYIFCGHTAFLIAFSAAAAEALSDTCGSGFGALSRGAFDIFKMRKIEKGMSGGVSLIGTLASLAGAAVISVVPLLFGAVPYAQALLILLAAFCGSVFDSFLGSLFQVKYRCKRCGKLTESPTHCNTACEKAAGFSAIDNDVVNLSSGAFSAILALIMYVLVFA